MPPVGEQDNPAQRVPHEQIRQEAIAAVERYALSRSLRHGELTFRLAAGRVTLIDRKDQERIV